jgi:hypothetical protein
VLFFETFHSLVVEVIGVIAEAFYTNYDVGKKDNSHKGK